MSAINDRQLVIEMIDLLAESIGAIKTAHMEKMALEAQLAQLKSPVVLEKVATVNESVFVKLANVLVDHSLIDEEEKDKFVASLKKDPNQLVGVIKQALTISAPFPTEGRGIPKSASSRDDDEVDALWRKVVREGA
jgi:flagellar biosynthesis regulator FlbT